MEGSPVWSLGDIVFDPDTPDRHGTIRTPGWKSERTITLEGRAFSPDIPTLRRAAARLTGLLADPHRPLPLTCYAETGPVNCDEFLDDQILTTPGQVAAPRVEWSLQVVAPDPRRVFPGLLPRWNRAIVTGRWECAVRRLPLVRCGRGRP